MGKSSSARFRGVESIGLNLVALLVVVLAAGCSGGRGGERALTAELPLHLEEHLDEASIEGSEVPDDLPAPLEWRFDQPQPGWKPVDPIPARSAAVRPVRAEDALRLPLTEDMRSTMNTRLLAGFIYVELPDLRLEDWAYVEIRARASDGMRNMGLIFNYTEEDPENPDDIPFYSGGDRWVPLMSDGTVRTYQLSLNSPQRVWAGPWTHLGIWFNCGVPEAPAALDILSVRVIPAGAEFAGKGAGVQSVGRRPAGTSILQAPHRRSLYMHAPGRVAYQVHVPEGGRLDVGLGVLGADVPVKFEINVQSQGSKIETLLQETYADRQQWGQRSVDLSHLEGQTVTLALETESERAGAVALWAAPTLSGTRTTDKPNIIFYIIDGAGADYMSVYGYHRRTTPNLERLALEGAIFERAYSNSSYTQPSTPSFLTSLQHSVLGGLKNGFNRVPDQVLTMAEHLHRAGYQTAGLTTNPNAGRMSNLERGVDVFREVGVQNESESSVELHENFWRWRDAYPGEPYWVHFQTTDVHGQHNPPAPFAGLYISYERRQILEGWERRLSEVTGVPGTGLWGGSFEQTGIDRVAYMSGMRDMYDQDMAHQDYQIGQLVARLKAAGEWERTLLIVAADHGAAAGSQDWGILMRDDVPPAYDFSHRGTPIFRSGVSRIPLIVVWPGHITPGQRFIHPVSMIDMLPTILDLANLPMPEVMQGQSLTPLLLGEEGWEPRPVIFDEFEVDRDTGELSGRIEVVDGRWGASLEINPKQPEDGEELVPGDRRPAPLLLYDLWNDPFCLNSLHEKRPDLVERYTAFLEAQWEAHQALAGQFTRSEDSPMTPEQLRTLRSLGYIE